MLSVTGSATRFLDTHIPTGTAANGYNVTAVVFASDNLGSTAVTSLGEDGLPLTIVSTPPDKA